MSVSALNNKKWRFSCPAKINLFLHITGRRSNGYHELETIFQLLNWGDDLYINQDESETNISLSQHPEVNFPIEENLIYKAAKLLQKESGCKKGAQLTLEKRIPIGAGLGGGSSNAATTLVALNHIWQVGMSLSELSALGLSLGADVPVFVEGYSAFANGIGEKLEPMALPENWFLVITPSIHVSTHEIFLNPQLTRDSSPIKIRALAARRGQNDCQAVVEKLYPEVANARKTLEKFIPVKMSGSGSSLFAECKDKGHAEQILNKLSSEDVGNFSAFIAQGTNRSPIFAEIRNQSELR